MHNDIFLYIFVFSMQSEAACLQSCLNLAALHCTPRVFSPSPGDACRVWCMQDLGFAQNMLWQQCIYLHAGQLHTVLYCNSLLQV